MISSFAGYSFCKAHSASYAMVSYQCAWLKTHYPAYFMARVIANEGGFYHRSAYIEEARRCGINILPPVYSTASMPPKRPMLAHYASAGIALKDFLEVHVSAWSSFVSCITLTRTAMRP